MHLSPVYPWFTSHLQRITHFGQLPLKTLIYLECSSILSWHQKCQHLFSGCFPLRLNLKKHVAMGQNSESQKGRFNHVHYGWRCWRQTNVGQKLSSPKAQQRKFDPYIIYIYIYHWNLALWDTIVNCPLALQSWPMAMSGVTLDSLALNVALSTGVAADKARVFHAGLWWSRRCSPAVKWWYHYQSVMLHGDHMVIILIYGIVW